MDLATERRQRFGKARRNFMQDEQERQLWLLNAQQVFPVLAAALSQPQLLLEAVGGNGKVRLWTHSCQPGRPACTCRPPSCSSGGLPAARLSCIQSNVLRVLDWRGIWYVAQHW